MPHLSRYPAALFRLWFGCHGRFPLLLRFAIAVGTQRSSKLSSANTPPLFWANSHIIWCTIDSDIVHNAPLKLAALWPPEWRIYSTTAVNRCLFFLSITASFDLTLEFFWIPSLPVFWRPDYTSWSDVMWWMPWGERVQIFCDGAQDFFWLGTVWAEVNSGN